MNKIKAIICALLTLCILSVPLASSVVFEAGAEEESLQDQIDALNKKSKEYQDTIDKTAKDISSKEKYGEALTGKISTLSDKIALTKKSISKIDSDISKKQGEIDKKNTEIDKQVKALGERLRIVYKAGSASDLEILLGAKDFGDFIDKVSLVKSLSDNDKKLINDINDKIDSLNADKKKLEGEKKKLQDEKDSLDDDLKDLQDLEKDNKAVLADLAKKSEQAQKNLRDTSSEKGKLEAEAARSFAQQAAQADTSGNAGQTVTIRDNTNNSSSSSSSSDDYDDDSDSSDDSEQSYTPSGSGYTWPCPGFYYLSSLWNEDRYTYNHGAIDIAGAGIMGATVVAADSGTVAYTNTYCPHNYGKSSSCGCGGGYGKYVWINHGNGKETIYAHLTSVSVSPGQYVSKGQVIGYVGTTGYSTGPHLHFECRYNGVKYNPMNEY